MDIQKIAIDRKEARELYRKYKTHQHYSAPMDDEIRRAYQLIAQGRMVIRALESIRLAGVDAAGLPKLAIARADKRRCHLELRRWGGARMNASNDLWRDRSRARSLEIEFPNDTFPRPKDGAHASFAGLIPIVPVHLRPKRGLANYHILWEAEWTPTPPRDPYLLRRIGKGDMWLVCAGWDLTEVERAAMAARMNS